MTTDEALAAAWSMLCPSRVPTMQFPNGFWPDVARVACEMLAQNTTTPTLNFRPTTCSRGNWPEAEPSESGVKSGGKKSSAASRAANTAALLAKLGAGS